MLIKNISIAVIAVDNLDYLASSINLIDSIYRHHRDIYTTLITNFQDFPEINQLCFLYSKLSVKTVVGVSSREIKTQLYKYVDSPYGLYIDADAIVLKPIPWDLIPKADMSQALCQVSPYMESNLSFSAKEREYTFSLMPKLTLQYNSGVIFWQNNNRSRLMFDLWHCEWEKFRGRDQFAFHRTLLKYSEKKSISLNFKILPGKLNSPSHKKDTIIYHSCEKMIFLQKQHSPNVVTKRETESSL